MASRVFALIIGIDKYKFSNIWNLESCVDDAQSIKRWLSHDLHVPREQIRLLTDSQATKQAIEDSFMSHLVNNPAIEEGDAILIYFAGHGGTIPSPRGWYTDGMKDVQVLCPYDHDTKSSNGRIAGISDRSFHAMLKDLSAAKGNNITVILDCCFAAPLSFIDRKHTRWTPTEKATGNDLFSCLWPSARASPTDIPWGFTRAQTDSHMVLAAAQDGEIAIEGKGGGIFTHAFLSVKDTTPLHSLTYSDLIELIEEAMEGHKPALAGLNDDRIVFDGTPFDIDPRFVAIDTCDENQLRVEAGAIHGVVEGTEFSIHDHNYTSSLNPSRATFLATEIHPTWCLARSKSRSKIAVDHEGWARITRWNNRAPFRVHLRRSLFSLFRRCRLHRALSSSASSHSTHTTQSNNSREGVNIVRVRHASQADVSVTLRKREMVVERHDAMLATNCRRVIHLPSSDSGSDLKALDVAARFHLHLHRKNPWKPMLGLVTMELYRLDATSWTRVSGNLLVDGRAQIVDDDKNSIYSVVVHNYSDYDLWPYLVSMDSGGYSISMVYHPEATLSGPPLRAHSHMVIGSGSLDSEALSFALADGASTGATFLKLFVSSVYTPMTFIEQGTPSTLARNPLPTEKTKPKGAGAGTESVELWDSVVSCVTIVRRSPS
ncbi:hypothetical protein EIP86_005037 [Pleurotus ostreatoroseus]|nr:hypothetical protein EIP86_005037 [Pleurotus ostreatoroseus]